ncbi:hypothetical protein [uncultured Brevundimonas sp.]|uniref:hypothetical protein n=1 Tax=uncultured Brevundimonas sp. TaxID=213418 RepID=UPI0030ED92E5|tara:strand:+ start:85990 stop:86268 length:279 start_codon:yes stop_codon:yes gene_type:complete
MRPRSPGPRRRDRLFAGALQRARLEMLSRGEAEPVGPRETLFVAALRAGDRPDPEEFILSATLLLAEAMTLQAGRGGEHPDDADLLDDDQTG